MADLHPDHIALLALARRAIDAERGPLWKTAPDEACEIHGTACDAVWDELRRQVDMAAGRVPDLEHPSVKQLKLAKRMRATILATCAAAVDQALNDLDFQG